MIGEWGECGMYAGAAHEVVECLVVGVDGIIAGTAHIEEVVVVEGVGVVVVVGCCLWDVLAWFRSVGCLVLLVALEGVFERLVALVRAFFRAVCFIAVCFQK